jgi:hypothetical protein
MLVSVAHGGKIVIISLVGTEFCTIPRFIITGTYDELGHGSGGILGLGLVLGLVLGLTLGLALGLTLALGLILGDGLGAR